MLKLFVSALVSISLAIPIIDPDTKQLGQGSRMLYRLWGRGSRLTQKITKSEGSKETVVTSSYILSLQASYSYAVDFSVLGSTSTFSCLYNSNYAVVFVRAYNPSGSGSFDTNSVTNVKRAYSAGLGSEAYMTPQPSSSKTGSQQLDEVYNGLINNGVTLRSIWVQVTSPVNWGGNVQTNVNFISQIVSRAQQRGLSVGIYTNAYDWNQITNDYTGLNSTSLWYWNVYGAGLNGESPADFSDFRPFGSWSQPVVKQFAQVETYCSITVNRDVYYSTSVAHPSLLREEIKNGNIVVGGNFM